MIKPIILIFIVLNLLSCGHSAKENPLYRPSIEEFIVQGRAFHKLEKLSILQSLVDLETVVFTLVTKEQTIKVKLYQKNQLLNIDSAIDLKKINSPKELSDSLFQLTVKLPISETDYELVILNHDDKVLDWRTFKHMDLSKSKKSTFAITSCMDDSYSVQDQMWSELADKNADVLLMIGDNVYGDKGIGPLKTMADPHDLWKRYFETRSSLKIFKLSKLIPTLATWDDHDYGKNNSDKSYPYKNESAEIFRAFFPHYTSKELIAGPGISYKVQVAGQQLYFLDMRTFRDSESNKDGDHLGPEMRAWLFPQLQKEKKPIWLISGDQFFGEYHPFESFQGLHPKQFTTFLNELKKVNNPFIFVSGDRHLTELMEIPEKFTGKKSYEITSSGIHARVSVGNFLKHHNPYKIAGAEGVYNYVILETDYSSKFWLLNVKAFGPSNNLLYEKKIEFPFILKK